MLADDTIAAISTPPGEGAVAVIRVSGPDAITLARNHRTQTALRHL
jgi:tRNA modification GTPase